MAAMGDQVVSVASGHGRCVLAAKKHLTRLAHHARIDVLVSLIRTSDVYASRSSHFRQGLAWLPSIPNRFDSLYNAVNTLRGYQQIAIFSPREVIKYEDEEI